MVGEGSSGALGRCPGRMLAPEGSTSLACSSTTRHPAPQPSPEPQEIGITVSSCQAAEQGSGDHPP